MPACTYCDFDITTNGSTRGNRRRYKCPNCQKNPSYPEANVLETGKNKSPSEHRETFSISGEVRTSDKIIEIVYAERKNPESLLLAHGFEPERWTLLTATNNFWHSQRPNDAGQLVMGQSKITCRPRQGQDITLDQIEKLLKSLKPISAPKLRKLDNYRRDGKKWLEVAVADLHVGDEHTKEVVEKFLYSIQEIAVKIKGTGTKVCFAVMGDVAHFDTKGKTTTNGTPQVVGMEYDEMWNTASETMIQAISILADVAEVDVVPLSGNHDDVTAFSIFKAIEYYFRFHPRVKVDSAYSNRKYRVFGPTLVYFVHGDMSMKNLISLCQREARKEFGESIHAEIHLGHMHHEEALEKDGVTLRWLKALVKTNRWHYDMGHTGSSRALMSFLWGEQGLEEIWYSR